MDQETLTKEVQKRLLQQSDLVSSSASGIEAGVSSAVEGVKTSQEKSAQRIESQFGRELGFSKEQQAADIETAREGQRGGAVQTQGLRRLFDVTEKELKDMGQRKEELILQGESDAAAQISQLQFQALEFQQKAEQQVFSNLLGMGQFATGLEQLQLATKQEARLSTAQELDSVLSREKFEFTKIATLSEQRQSQQRINLLSAELKLKQIELGLDVLPDDGFSSVTVQNQTGVQANALLQVIQVKRDEGIITSDEEEEASTIESFMELRRVLSKAQVNDDALASMFGMQFDDDGELGFIGGNINAEDVPLPGESEGLGAQVREFFGAEERERTSETFEERRQEIRDRLEERKIEISEKKEEIKSRLEERKADLKDKAVEIRGVGGTGS